MSKGDLPIPRTVIVGTLLMLGTFSALAEERLAERKPALLSRDKEVALALSAAPELLKNGAGVYALEKNGFVRVRESQNGFTCIVNRDHPLNLKPTCYDAEGTATILPKVLRVGELLMEGRPIPSLARESSS